MQRYRYQAARQDGAIVRGLLEASGAGEATGVLVDRGLYPLRVDPADPSENSGRRVSKSDLAIAFRSIAALTAAGVPLERAVGASEAVTRGALRQTLIDARTQLRAGRSLAQALDNGSGAVPPLITGMLRAGERGSQLSQALEQVAQHLEQEAELAARVRQALAYPVLLLVAGGGSIVLIGTVVVPKFAAVLGDLGQELPPATRFLLAGSSLVMNYGILLLVAIGAAGAALINWVRRPAGGLQWDRLLLRLPLIGPVRHALATARVGRALSGTLAAGMPILPALDAARDAAGDRAVAERIGRARERVVEGETLAAAIQGQEALTPSAIQLVAVGEGSGQLGAMTGRAGDLAAREAERGLRSLVALLEPALVVLFGGMVAFVAAALLQAVYSIRPG
jgi:type II secretory pathway component PulF